MDNSMYLLGQLVGLVYANRKIPRELEIKLLSRPQEGFHALLLRPETIEMIYDPRVVNLVECIPVRPAGASSAVVDVKAFRNGVADMRCSLHAGSPQIMTQHHTGAWPHEEPPNKLAANDSSADVDPRM
ncbi:hypothetical protein [Chitinolyticbacter meiyuanensis]|uniref:hypothetical protein n=1 Tax=Chitinolyticbacter meiyuanensis TaxID=682798 RepID=UPI0011E5C146|nr:hypothetical protein [Chitinolyticbacter meiyuanensis]